MKRGFVLCACGNDRASRVNIALRFLKRFTKNEIVVVRSRTFIPISHDQVIEFRSPQGFSDHAAYSSLVTAIHRVLPAESGQWCFLDSEMIAVDHAIDKVFDRRRGPVAFARGNADIDSQSGRMLKCGCSSSQCRHLRQAIKKMLSVAIGSGSWLPWDPAIFVFGSEGLDFLDVWHQYAVQSNSSPDPAMKRISGDRWTLAAAVWKAGLQNVPALPQRYHRVVDGFTGIPREDREYTDPSALAVDNGYSLSSNASSKPAFIHFVNGTAGAKGWKNWDDVAALLEPSTAASNGATAKQVSLQSIGARTKASAARRRSALTPVHGMWVGTSLSRMELLTLTSFVRQGHRFHLWAYDPITTPVPGGVVLEDATEILPRDAVFARRSVDPHYGVGRGSFGSPFSDLFRYKLLYEKGGYWADMDVTCLKPFPSDTPYLFRTHRIGAVGNIMKCPRHSRLMAETFEQTMALVSDQLNWLAPNQILTENIKRLGLTGYIRRGFCNPDLWTDVIQPLIEQDIEIPEDWFAIHWLNEVWRTLNQDRGKFKGRMMLNYTVDKDQAKQGTTLARLYTEHGLDSRPECGESFNSNGHALGNGKLRSRRLPSRNHLNVLSPTLAIGGAERIVIDTLTALADAEPGTTATLFVMDRAEPSYSGRIPGVETVQFSPRNFSDSCDYIAGRVLRSGTPTLFVHIGSEALLRKLWDLGTRTIPVVHNTAPGWTAPAAFYNDSHVPFVIAVCDRVARELRERGCLKRIVVVRHEIQRSADSAVRIENRRKIRARYGILDDTLLVGMVGQFKRQKNYPKAVEVLAALRQLTPAKLMILGPWDHSWADGRQVFADTYRTACDLNVVADLITVGAAIDVEDYYPAFDILLSTSSYEGLSISMMEATSLGCPIVSSEVGGAAEITSDSITLLPQDGLPDEYAGAILTAARTIATASDTVQGRELIPAVWSLLGQFGDPEMYRHEPDRPVCIVQSLDPDSELSKVVQRLARAGKIQYVIALGPVDRGFEKMLRSHNVEIFDATPASAGLGDWNPNGSKDHAGPGIVRDDRSPSGLTPRSVPEVSVRSDNAVTELIMALTCVLRTLQELGATSVYIAGVECPMRLLLAKILPPETVTLYDADSNDVLFSAMAAHRDFQRRIAFDESAYFRRISPWPRSRYRYARF